MLNNILHLRNFVIVVECGSITRAAEIANVAQTALGVQMRNLEADLRVSLLRRHSRGVEPTEAGRLLYDRARALLRQVEELRRDVALLGGEREERITLGVPPSVVKLIGRELVAEMRRALPLLTLNVIEDLSFKLVRALGTREIDCAIVFDPDELVSMRTLPVLRERLLFVTPAGPEGAGLDLENPITLKKALSRELAATSHTENISRLVERAAAGLGLSFHAAFEVRSIETIKTLITRGLASAFLPYGIIADELKAGTLHAQPVCEPEIEREMFFVCQSAMTMPSDEAAFMDALNRTFALLNARNGPLSALVGAEPAGRAP